MLLTWPDQVDKNFQGRTKMFSTIAENFLSYDKNFWRDNFFLTVPVLKLCQLVAAL